MTESEDVPVSDETLANGWTKSEMLALQGAMRESFGACTCGQHIVVGHTVAFTQTCEGHAFLQEKGFVLDRPTFMLHMRRDRDRWQLAEFIGTCTECGRDNQIHDVDRWDLDDGGQRVCIECIHQRHLAEVEQRMDRGDAPPPSVLPW